MEDDDEVMSEFSSYYVAIYQLWNIKFASLIISFLILESPSEVKSRYFSCVFNTA